MLSNEFVSSLFGPDDEDEKYFNKKDKKERKISYNHNPSHKKAKKRIKKKGKIFL